MFSYARISTACRTHASDVPACGSESVAVCSGGGHLLDCSGSEHDTLLIVCPSESEYRRRLANMVAAMMRTAGDDVIYRSI
jgi:hypothetical protein